MASVFLSYDREDAEKARSIAAALEKAGHSVWWDRHIKGGAQYSKVIDKALKAADAVVVLWSERSVESAWVRDEAAAGRDSGRLVPVSLDSTEPPLGFRQYHTIDLSGWRGRGRPPSLDQLHEAAASLAGKEPVAAPARPLRALAPADHLWPALRRYWWLIIGLLILLLGLAIARPWEVKATTPVVLVQPAEPTAGSRSLARDLLVRLGSAQPGRTDTMQLVDENGREKPELILEVAATTSARTSSATLVLLRAEDRQLLSSEDISASDGGPDDPKMSAAMAATIALGCATESLSSRSRLRLDLLKQYLGACAQFGKVYPTEDASVLIPPLERVVQRAPDFLPARKQLLLAGASMLALPTELAKPSQQWLSGQIDTARRIQGTMPELGIAEMELLPTTRFANRLELVDRLYRDFPNNIFVLGARAEQLMVVGRLNDAVVDAERAARVDPLVPYARNVYIRALAFSGRLPRAFEELNNFAPTSLAAMNLSDTRFRVNMRYGDAQHALRLLHMYGTSKAHEFFLTARIEPTQRNVSQSIAMSRAAAVERGFYGQYSEVLEAFGRDDEAFEMLMNVPPVRVDQVTLQTLFRPTLKNLRQRPRFLLIAQRFGLLDYWQKSGKWPDFCSDPDLPYDCKKEAAKLAA